MSNFSATAALVHLSTRELTIDEPYGPGEAIR